MHRDDIYNRISCLPTPSLEDIKAQKAAEIERQDLPRRHPRNWRIWLRIYNELENRKKEQNET